VATGKRIELDEMIFCRFDGDLVAESCRMVHPEVVSARSAAQIPWTRLRSAA